MKKTKLGFIVALVITTSFLFLNFNTSIPYDQAIREQRNSQLDVFLRNQTDPTDCWNRVAFSLAALERQKTSSYPQVAEYLKAVLSDRDNEAPWDFADLRIEPDVGNDWAHLDKSIAGTCYSAQIMIPRIFLHSQFSQLPNPSNSPALSDLMRTAFEQTLNRRSLLSDLRETNIILDSENHNLTRRSTHLIMAGALYELERAEIKKGTRTSYTQLRDSNVAQNYNALRNYWKSYLQKMGKNGNQLENASVSYSIYTLGALMLVADLAHDRHIRAMTRQFLHTMMADTSLELFPVGSRGGSSGRTYKDEDAIDRSQSTRAYAWLYGWLSPSALAPAPAQKMIPIIASSYFPPPQTKNLVANKFASPASGDLITYFSTRPASIHLTKDTAIASYTQYPGSFTEILDFSPIVRTTSISRNFMLGAEYFPMLDLDRDGVTDKFTAGMTQNLRMGLSFNSGKYAQISFMGRGTSATDSIFGGKLKGVHEINGIVSGRTGLFWRDPRAEDNDGIFLYFSLEGNLWSNSTFKTADTNALPADGWYFTKSSSGEFIAINVAGSFNRRAVCKNTVCAPEDPRYGYEVFLNDIHKPVVMEIMESTNGMLFEDFQRAVRNLRLNRNGNEVVYTSLNGTPFRVNSDNALARVNTIDVARSDQAFWNNPYLSGPGTRIVFSYPGYASQRYDLNFPPTRCEMVKPLICPDSTNDPFVSQDLVNAPPRTAVDCQAYSQTFSNNFCKGNALITTRWYENDVLKTSSQSTGTTVSTQVIAP